MKTIFTALAATLLATTVQAHVTLEQPSAQAGTYYKAVLRVGHGCDGQATQRVSVDIPEGVDGVKPMPKAGWTVTTERSGEEVSRIVWEGSLDDAFYDEFAFRAHLGDDLPADAPLYFPTTQDCADGQEAWVNIPAEGTDWHDTEYPAPVLLIEGADPHAHH